VAKAKALDTGIVLRKIRAKTHGGKMFRKSFLTGLLLLGLAGVTIPAAQGSIVFTLNQSATFGSGPFGTVTIDQTSNNLATVTETLASGVNWAGTGAGEALEFNFLNDPALIITIAPANTANFSVGVVPPAPTASPYGTYDYFIHCTTCSGGTGPTGTLTFTVALASNANFNISSFEVLSTLPPGSTPAYVASDICFQASTGACTSNVAATSFVNNNPTVPEPVTSGLVGTGLISLFFLRRRVRG
jgi:hypothetical protein